MLDTSCNNIILNYKGPLSYDIIGELIISLKNKMKHNTAQFGNYKRILTLMIESLENIVRYTNTISSFEEMIKKYPAEFIICHTDGIYTIETANIIQNSDEANLRKRIDTLREMNQDEIKELYKETITDGKFSEDGGAGLGLIEMAKIADEKIKYEFSAVDEGFSYFILRLILK